MMSRLKYIKAPVKVMQLVSVFFVLSFTSAFTLLSINWEINSSYSIKFSGGVVSGTFSGFKGEILFDENDPANSKMDVEIDVATINTGKEKMDKHARNEEWLDVKKYPKIFYKSLSVAKTANGYSVLGELNFHGIKKAVSIPFNFKNEGGTGVFIGSFKINRKDFGIEGNSFGFMVNNLFDVELRVPVTKKNS